jgi:hypothetical protein
MDHPLDRAPDRNYHSAARSVVHIRANSACCRGIAALQIWLSGWNTGGI